MRAALFGICLIVVAACQPLARQPAQTFSLGALVLRETFDDASDWETWRYADIRLRVENGGFRITAGQQGYVWSLNDQVHTDVVIEAHTRQLSAHLNNGYGVLCRARDNGDGYYFLISGDGYYSIRRGAGRAVQPLVEWEASAAIQQGMSANDLRAVCIGRYLALYVNGLFVAEYEDTAYTQGYPGLTAAAERGDVDVTFDDVMIYEASSYGE
ncbi:MAG: hypothetical protein HXY40_00990 [Chloroflexi bacterium]|nr:hypothetical protein [Chloroflexota bacterium]